MKTHLPDVFLEVARRVDGANLVAQALTTIRIEEGAIHVLAFGKVSFPMFEGLAAAVGTSRIASGLVIAPETRFPAMPRLPPGVRAMVADHPQPTARSVTAAHEATAFVAARGTNEHLVVLLSGGGSSLLAAPAGSLTLDEKSATVRAVARGGATISELNTVRKHLSSLKGGQLGVSTRARTSVLAISDVVGNGPGTIASSTLR